MSGRPDRAPVQEIVTAAPSGFSVNKGDLIRSKPFAPFEPTRFPVHRHRSSYSRDAKSHKEDTRNGLQTGYTAPLPEPPCKRTWPHALCLNFRKKLLPAPRGGSRPARLPSTGLLLSLRDRIFLITDPIAETSRVQAPLPTGEMQGQQIGTRRHAGTAVDDGTLPIG